MAGTKNPEAALEELLGQAEDFSIKKHDDFQELEVLAEALKDTVSQLLLEPASARKGGRAGEEALPEEIQRTFRLLEEAIAVGNYNAGSWSFDGSVEEALRTLGNFVGAIREWIENRN